MRITVSAVTEAVTEEQFKKWDSSRRTAYLKKHPGSKFSKMTKQGTTRHVNKNLEKYHALKKAASPRKSAVPESGKGWKAHDKISDPSHHAKEAKKHAKQLDYHERQSAKYEDRSVRAEERGDNAALRKYEKLMDQHDAMRRHHEDWRNAHEDKLNALKKK